MAQEPYSDGGHLFVEASQSHSVGLPKKNDQPDAETST